MSRMLLLRLGLVFGAVEQAATGTWPLFWPRQFYENFPLPSHPWETWLPAYNEHFIRDFGALNLALALLFAISAYTMDRLLIRSTAAAYLVFGVFHLVFHANHLMGVPRVDAIVQIVSLVVGVLGPLALIALTWGMPQKSQP